MVAETVDDLTVETLRECRVKAGLTQARLGRLMGADTSVISRVECGRWVPAPEWLAAAQAAILEAESYKREAGPHLVRLRRRDERREFGVDSEIQEGPWSVALPGGGAVVITVRDFVMTSANLSRLARLVALLESWEAE